MIKITLDKNSIHIEGHANYAETNDIVCASVSTVLQSAQLALRVLANQYPLNIALEDINAKIKRKV